MTKVEKWTAKFPLGGGGGKSQGGHKRFPLKNKNTLHFRGGVEGRGEVREGGKPSIRGNENSPSIPLSDVSTGKTGDARRVRKGG